MLSDVTFSVERGERVGIIGLNGAGKTTLFHVISGTVALLGTFLRFLASLELDEEFNFEDSGRLRHHVQLHSAGSYAADAERSSLSPVDLLSEDKIEFSPKVQARDFKDALAIFAPVW